MEESCDFHKGVKWKKCTGSGHTGYENSCILSTSVGIYYIILCPLYLYLGLCLCTVLQYVSICTRIKLYEKTIGFVLIWKQRKWQGKWTERYSWSLASYPPTWLGTFVEHLCFCLLCLCNYNSWKDFYKDFYKLKPMVKHCSCSIVKEYLNFSAQCITVKKVYWSVCGALLACSNPAEVLTGHYSIMHPMNLLQPTQKGAVLELIPCPFTLDQMVP